MTDVTFPPVQVETRRIESHEQYVLRYQNLVSHAYAENAPLATKQLLMFIVERLRACNGTGYAPHIRFNDFVAAQRHDDVDTEACAKAWNEFEWPLSWRPSPTPRRLIAS